ncbi:hypothetical protein D0X99_03250 [Algoriphagus lacus]|uniref:Uncharacterized protein n=1 Tax=Algoriphagus lacus TaxID=2056311 RepID=A0A418PX50_9BACT|nr:hypothetical protein D0X99_03250 [Algoriphagus lacus]
MPKILILLILRIYDKAKNLDVIQNTQYWVFSVGNTNIFVFKKQIWLVNEKLTCFLFSVEIYL